VSTNFEAREKPNSDPYDQRWILVDPLIDKVVDDAQGYGYRSKQGAIKAGWYKFSGGRQKVESTKHRALSFWKKYPKFADRIQDMMEENFKEIFRGELDIGEGITELAKEMGIENFDAKFLNHMP